MSDPHTWAAQRNAHMPRDDIEWFVAASGELMLRDKPSWQAAHTKKLAEAAERERQQYNHRQRYPIQEAAE